MRIGIDCRAFRGATDAPHAGTSTYTFELVRHLLDVDQENEYVLFFDYEGKKRVARDARFSFLHHPRVTLISIPFSRFRRFLPFIYSHFIFRIALGRAHLDVFHAPAHPFPLGYRGASVYTMHDLAIYDHPEWFASSWIGRQVFSTHFVVPQSIHHARRIIVVSHATARDLARHFRIPQKKVRVIYEGAPEHQAQHDAPHVVLERFGIEEPYLFFLGTLEPRKNLVRALRAFVAAQQQRTDRRYSLILAGGLGWKYDSIFEEINTANIMLGRSAVRYIGYVTEEEKKALFTRASLFLWPSLYEGFGLPVLEAMGHGVPVVTSHSGALAEIVGDAACVVHPEREQDIVTALVKMLHDVSRQEQLRERGKKRAQLFSWKETAQETLTVYREVYQETH